MPNQGPHKRLVDVEHRADSMAAAVWRQKAMPKSTEEAGQPRRFFPIALLMATNTLKWIGTYLSHRFGSRAKFQTYEGTGDTGIYPFPDSGEWRVALAGDWASGTNEAAEVAKRIAEKEPHVSIHLGDVYYVGDEAEVRENFMGESNPDNDYDPCLWPKGSELSFALNGNHEMYARGIAYFTVMLPWLGQKASFFALENAHWRILGLDTGYHSVGTPILEYIFPPGCKLPDDLVAWLDAHFAPDKAAKKPTIVLTHHQPISRFEKFFKKPGQQLAKYFDQPVLWLWGHEHWLTVYKPATLESGLPVMGRCIGHGGMPCELPKKAPNPQFEFEFHDDRIYSGEPGLGVGYNGFALLKLDGADLRIDYIDLEGTLNYWEAWQSTGGGGMTRKGHANQ